MNCLGFIDNYSCTQETYISPNYRIYIIEIKTLFIIEH